MKFAHDRQHVEPHRPRPRRTAEALTHEEQHADFFFDPEVELSQADQDQMFADVNITRGAQPEEFCRRASTFLTIFPERYQQFHSGTLSANLMRKIRFFQDSDKHIQGSDRCATLSAGYLRLFPGVREPLKLNEEMAAQLVSFARKVMGGGDLYPFCELVFDFLTLFPQKRNELSTEDVYRILLKDLNGARGKNWNRFGEIARTMMLLFPDAREELHLDTKAMDGMYDRFRESRGRNSKSMAQMAMSLRILSHQRAEINDAGELVLTPFPPKMTKSSLLPARPHAAA